MKKAITIIVSLMFVLSITGLCFAAEKAMTRSTMKEQSAEKAAPVKIMHVWGEVTAVDAKAGTLTIKSKKEEVSLSTNDKTVIRTGKEKKTLADIKVGEKVRARYSEVDGKNLAKSISYGSMKMAEKPEKTTEKSKATR
jgi:Cu/Ag efflux protein CusF